MQNNVPIACSLTAADLQDRQQAWLKLGRYSEGSQEVPGGLAFVFTAAAGVFASLHELVRLEAECCPWMVFTLDDSAAGVTMKVTASGSDGERGVRESFAPLVAAGPPPSSGRAR